MDRRRFLRGTVLGFSAVPLFGRSSSHAAATVNPFQLGVASGDATATSMVLWTRLVPTPHQPSGGMPVEDIEVSWQVSSDADFRHIVLEGQATASPELAHSVHIELDELTPATEYWYRFATPGHYSPIGRTKTLPGYLNPEMSLRFVTASCQNFTHGHFVAYRHIVRDKPDFLIHLGDYLYETAFGENVRSHPTDQPPQTLDEFRLWHAHYKSDPDLRAAHAALPFFAVLDNHDAVPDGDSKRSEIRRAAYQAWYEHMPVRGYSGAGADQFSMHRCIKMADVAQICLLDPRQHRDAIEPCGTSYDLDYGFGNYRQRCTAVFEKSRSLLGEAQSKWLVDRINKNTASWNVIASPGPFQPFSYRVGEEDRRYIGAWDAYPTNRREIANALSNQSTGKPLILSGDVHSFWAYDGAKTPWAEERFPLKEFTTSSISARWPPELSQPVSDNLEHNPQVRFYDPKHRGYMLHDVSADQWLTSARGVSSVLDRSATIRTIVQFRIDRDYTLTIKQL